ncbi:DUF4180 domain-containing protein [bacterium]|nr:DUF4180 domain-containing protein [bacterium]
MELTILQLGENRVAEIRGDEVVLSTVQDALDLMGNADYQGARSLILHEKQLDPAFFDLKTRLAGEILQKYVNYRFRLAIVGDFDKYSSSALRAFILECYRGEHISFVKGREEAVEKLT